MAPYIVQVLFVLWISEICRLFYIFKPSNQCNTQQVRRTIVARGCLGLFDNAFEKTERSIDWLNENESWIVKIGCDTAQHENLKVWRAQISQIAVRINYQTPSTGSVSFRSDGEHYNFTYIDIWLYFISLHSLCAAHFDSFTCAHPHRSRQNRPFAFSSLRQILTIHRRQEMRCF